MMIDVEKNWREIGGVSAKVHTCTLLKTSVCSPPELKVGGSTPLGHAIQIPLIYKLFSLQPIQNMHFSISLKMRKCRRMLMLNWREIGGISMPSFSLSFLCGDRSLENFRIRMEIRRGLFQSYPHSYFEANTKPPRITMAKRFADTDKIKKAFWRALSLEEKVFWDYICLDCSHAGIWEVDFETFRIRTGVTLNPLTIASELRSKIQILDGGTKWFIPSFVEFQYQIESYLQLNPDNRVHQSVIQILRKAGVYNSKTGLIPIPQGHPEAPYVAPCLGAKDKDKEKDMDKDKEKEKDKDPAFKTSGLTRVDNSEWSSPEEAIQKCENEGDLAMAQKIRAYITEKWGLKRPGVVA